MFSSVVERLNERRAAAVDSGMDSGFTLIELMVVLLILAILLAIAIPTFLGVTGGANDRAAQSNLNTALTTAKAAETQNQQCYNTVCGGSIAITNATLHTNEPSIKFDASGAPETAQGPVSVYVSPDGQGVVLASFSKNNNTCWLVVDNLTTIAAPPTGGGGAYGATQSLGGTATQAPSNPGNYYGSSTSGCDAGAAPTGVTWGSHF